MRYRIRLAYGAAFTAAVLLLHCREPASAAPCLQYPHRAGCPCIPNAHNFGYFRTVWRQWPGEARPNQTFPESVGVEVIPTPRGKREAPAAEAETPGGARPTTPGAVPPGEDFRIETGLPGVLPEPAVEPSREPGLQPLPEPGAEPPTEPFPDDTLPGTPGPVEEPSLLEPSIPGALPDAGPGAGGPAPTEPPLDDSAKAGPPQQPEPSPPTVRQTAGESARLPEPAEPQASKPPPEAVADAQAAPQEPSVSEGPALAAQVPAPKAPPPEQPAESPPAAKPAGTKPPTATGSRATPAATGPQANWMAALHPGFRGHADRAAGIYPSTEPALPTNPPATVASRSMPAVRKSAVRSLHEQRAKPGLPQPHRSPVALDGYCPVELAEHERWVPGDARFTVDYQGKTYLLAGAEQRQRFLQNPERYAPVLSGYDPVLAVEGQCKVPGKTDYCVTYHDRLYMFSSAVTLTRFQNQPQRYSATVR